MANTVEVQVINDGPRNLCLKIHIDGDGSGDESARLLIDVSQYLCEEINIMGLQGSLVGFSAELIWEASVNKHAIEVPDYDVNQDFRSFGGLPNNAGAGKTGDVLITTTGLGNGDTGHIVMHCRKRGPLIA